MITFRSYIKSLTQQPVHGVPVPIDERGDHVHHPQDDEGEEEEGDHGLLGPGHQAPLVAEEGQALGLAEEVGEGQEDEEGHVREEEYQVPDAWKEQRK